MVATLGPVRIVSEIDPLLADIRALAPELAQAPAEFVDRFCSAVEAGVQLATVDLDGAAATAAGELRVVLQPSDFLRGLMAAVRARNFDLGIFEQAHELGSSAGGDSRRLAESDAPPCRLHRGGASTLTDDAVPPREDLCAFDAYAMNVIEGRAKP